MQTLVFCWFVAVAVVLFLGVLLVVCVVAGAIGQAVARRHRWQCPQCDYRPPRGTRDADMLIHRVLEHERE